MKNQIAFKVYGRYGLFTDPLTRVGGEKFTYHIPTYQSLIGIVESIYWKPTLIWVIDKVRIMKAMQTETKGIRPIKYHTNTTDLSRYTYLLDVEYQVLAHFEWNIFRDDLIEDRNENKHYFIAKRMLERGGRRDIFLGTRECQGYAEEIIFGSEEGFYDKIPELAFDLMFHGFNYPDDTGKPLLEARFWRPVMRYGVIEFPRPDKCEINKVIREMEPFKMKTSGSKEAELLEGYVEEDVMHELDTKAL